MADLSEEEADRIHQYVREASRQAKNKKWKKKGKNLAPGKERKTPKQIEEIEKGEGKARPADFIEPYYGDSFGEEIEKASWYNESKRLSGGRPALIQSSYDRIFDDVEFQKKDYVDASYAPKGPLGKGNPQIELPSNLSRKDHGELVAAYKDAELGSASRDLKKDPKWERQFKKQARDHFEFNGIDPMVADVNPSADEHEFGHHYARPVDQSIWGSNVAPYHMAKDSEMVNALGRLQREMFRATGKRFETPESFNEFIDKGEIPDFLSTEGRRMIETINSVKKRNPKAGETIQKEAARKVPSLVKQQEEEDNRAMVRSYLEGQGLV